MNHTRIRFAPDDGFRQAVMTGVDAYFAASGKRRTAGASIYIKGAAYGALAVGSYAALLAGAFGPAAALPFALVYGLALAMLAVNVGHDAAHVALTGRRGIDSAVQRVLFALIGIDGYLWRMRHDGSHHVFPNVNGCDIDIDQNPMVRLSPNHPLKPWQRVQHLYAPLLYTLMLVDAVFVNDVLYLKKRSLANMRDIRHRRTDVALFWLGKLAYVALDIVLPLVLLPFAWWQILIGYLIVNGAMSLIFVFLFIGTHFSSLARFPAAETSGALGHSWAAHALATSVDWLPESRFVSLFSGGANAHAAHHLLPRLSSCHYPALTPIIADAAREFGLIYNATTFAGMIANHLRHLRAMARDEVSPDRTWREMPAR